MATTTSTTAAAERAARAGISTMWHLQIGWQYRAACKGPQSDLFFPPNHLERKEDRHERESAAKAICRRSEERRVGKEGRSRWSAYQYKQKQKKVHMNV